MEFSHVALLVSDIEQSASWYSQVFGWTELFRAEQTEMLGDGNGHGGRGRIVMGKVGLTKVEFVQMYDPTIEPWQLNDHYGLMLISVTVPDLAPIRANLDRLGVPIKREVDFGGTRLLMVADPDGIEAGFVGPRDNVTPGATAGPS
jgi:catechol 2,3-dioxygenase-like lactoylglutathione lyase family enzyme